MTQKQLMKMYGATHFAKLPDDTKLYYQVSEGANFTEIKLWFPHSGVWDSPNGLIPYTLKLL